MKSTALGAENIIFISDAHEKFYYEKLQEVRYQDVYHKALSRVRGNSHARFLEGKAVVIPLTYSTRFWRISRSSSARS